MHSAAFGELFAWEVFCHCFFGVLFITWRVWSLDSWICSAGCPFECLHVQFDVSAQSVAPRHCMAACLDSAAQQLVPNAASA
jgi:hypothetical protein